MRRLTSAGRVVAALLTFASLGAALPAAAAAQVDRNGERIPDRPRLRSKADSNDWQAYYTEGVKQLKKRPMSQIAWVDDKFYKLLYMIRR